MTKFRNLSILLVTALLLVLMLPASLTAQDIPEGLTILQADAGTLVATYASPHASLTLEMQHVKGMIKSAIRDGDGQLMTHFTVPMLDGEGLVRRYQTMVPKITDSLINDASQRKQYEKASFGTVWTYVQMAEELALRLSGSEVAPAMRAAVRLHPNVLGMAYEQAGALDPQNRPEKIPAYFTDDCNGACGPGCDWCVGVPFTSGYLCETNAFCILHDAYCGAWEDFFDCSFADCDIL